MGDSLGLIEMALVFGAALAWAVRELIVVRREQRKDREAERDRERGEG
jgi:hypothetical protein